MPEASIIVGLGNPGPKFVGTRHNVGWRVIDALSGRLGIPVNERRPKAVLGTGYAADRRLVLAKPRTFMNNSGEAVEYLLTRFGGKAADLLIIYDEMALPPGRIRLRAAGSDAGHNGIRSIISAVSGTGFPRLRVGIGAPPGGLDPVVHVLGQFDDSEADAIEEAVQRSADAVLCLLDSGIDTAMNRFNQDPRAETTQADSADAGQHPPIGDGSGSRPADRPPSQHGSQQSPGCQGEGA